MRVGIGYDIHRTIEGRPLVLGGIKIPSELGLEGHSDADCVLHAVIDALFGAAGLDDIGDHFPDTDPKYKDADSGHLLELCLEEVIAEGYNPVNVDVIVILEQPKLGPYKTQMAERIAELMKLPAHSVNVKAKTSEGLGPVGIGNAIAAQAVVMLDNKKG